VLFMTPAISAVVMVAPQPGPVLASLVGGVINAWLFLIKVPA
jgi:hypothetical protein